MAKKMKKLFSLVLAISMLMSLMTLAANAAGTLKCTKEVHTHGDGCYEQQLTCTKHVHSADCADPCELEVKDLICTKEEHAHKEECAHKHVAACYPVICESTEEGHVHGEGCYGSEPTCGLTYDCGKEVYAHSDACYAAHAHGDACYADVLVCTKEAHAHDADCYDQNDPYVDPSNGKIMIDKFATELDANDQVDVTLKVGGTEDNLGVDIIYILGSFLDTADKVQASIMISCLTDTFREIVAGGTPVNFGIVPFSSTKNPVLPLTTLKTQADIDALPEKIAAAVVECGNVYDGVNMENALVTAKEMFSASALKDHPHRQHLVMISSGHTYYFNSGENNEYISTVPVRFEKGEIAADEIFYMEKGWMRARNNETNSYPIPKAIWEEYEANPGKYIDLWDCYWYWIDQWAKADVAAGDTVVYEATTRAAGDFVRWMNSGNYSKNTGSDGKGGTYTYSGYGAVINNPKAEDIANTVLIDLDKAATKRGPNPFTDANAAHAISYERAMWEAYNYVQKNYVAAGINFYPVFNELRDETNDYPHSATNGYSYGWYDWTNQYIGHSFMNFLAGGKAVQYSKTDNKAFFDPIKAEIISSVSVGSTVEDYIGYEEGKGNFEFIQDASGITLTKSGVAYTTLKLDAAQNGADSSYTFTAPGATVPTFTMDYYRGNGTTTEKFIWTFGEDVSNAAPATLTYKLKLIDKATGDERYDVNTNISAVLDPKDSNGNDGADLVFPIPNVDYTNPGEPTDPPAGPTGPTGPVGPTPVGPEEDLDDPDVPLAGGPEEELGDEDVPLAGADGEEEIFEEDVPLAGVPATGDMTLVWAAASAVSAAGLFLVSKKSKDEE